MEYVSKTAFDDYNIEFKKQFSNNLKEIINNTIIPTFGSSLKFDIELGNFTSGEYGSYRIPFYNKENNLICYIIADTIYGKWEIFKTQ
jgi:mRNA-degrading endonuclease RelE of RelBE toxin-antitoxin system